MKYPMNTGSTESFCKHDPQTSFDTNSNFVKIANFSDMCDCPSTHTAVLAGGNHRCLAVPGNLSAIKLLVTIAQYVRPHTCVTECMGCADLMVMRCRSFSMLQTIMLVSKEPLSDVRLTSDKQFQRRTMRGAASLGTTTDS